MGPRSRSGPTTLQRCSRPDVASVPCRKHRAGSRFKLIPRPAEKNMRTAKCGASCISAPEGVGPAISRLVAVNANAFTRIPLWWRLRR